MTKRYKQFQPVSISDFEVTAWSHPVHKHNHYEIIYIKRGSGVHFINSVAINYAGGEVFLIGPEDEHYFEVTESTRFIYLKFTNLYLYQEVEGYHLGLRHLEYLVKSRETHSSAFVLEATDQRIMVTLFDAILALKNDLLKNEHIIWMQTLSIAHVLQRNMPEIKNNQYHSADLQAVFCYIHKNIYDPAMLKADKMSAQFNLTKDYIGPYFKRNTGSTLREYINAYRTQLIQERIASGRFGLKQIASEFGLTDESHVSKLLKKRSPS